MKPIKIVINQLGAIRNAEIELKPLMILTGESSLGKSYVAFLLHYIYRVLIEGRLKGFFSNKRWGFEYLKNSGMEEGDFTINTQELSLWINNNAEEYLKKIIGNPQLNIDVSIDIPFQSDSYVISYKTEMIGMKGKEDIYFVYELGPFAYRFPYDSVDVGDSPLSILLSSKIRKEIFKEDNISQTFMMAPGRGALLTIPQDFQNYMEKYSGMYAEFLEDWRIVKECTPQKHVDAELVDMLNQINGGSITMGENKQLLFVERNNRPIPISASASSIKELTPLTVLLSKFHPQQLSVLFEEPEAHLHPTRQIEIADFIVESVNRGINLQITTHSDYLLRRINDRIFLHCIKQNNPEIYSQLLTKFDYNDSTLNPELLGAYVLRKNADGYVTIEQQSLDEGIPFDTFQDAITKHVAPSLTLQNVWEDIKNAQ